MRAIRFWLAGLLALGGVFGLVGGYRAWEVRQLTAKVQELEQERQQLAEFAQRLSRSRRVAQVDVVDQLPDAQGRSVTAMIWHEIGEDGLLSAPLQLEVVGDLVYFEAAVIKFEHHHVGDADPGRSASLAVFRRVFGEHQAAASGPELNDALAPRLGLTDGEDAPDARLWDLFWRLMEDPQLAAKYGVRVAQIEAPAVRVRSGQVWEVTLDAAGGLNLRLLRDRAT